MPPKQNLYFPLIALAGLLVMGLPTLVFWFFYSSGLTFSWIFTGALSWLLGIALTAGVYFGLVRSVRSQNGSITFQQALAHCLLAGLMAGLLGTAFDVVFYSYISPGYQEKITLFYRSQVAPQGLREKRTPKEIAAKQADYDTMLKELKAHPPTAIDYLILRLRSELLLAGLFGFVFGIRFRPRFQ